MADSAVALGIARRTIAAEYFTRFASIQANSNDPRPGERLTLEADGMLAWQIAWMRLRANN
jgi:hypothetical protein